MKVLSNCCKAEVVAISSEEETSFYMCSKCKKACDLVTEMKEQVSVDENTPFVMVPKAEYQRLKRLDENVKALTNMLKSEIPNLIDKSHEPVIKQFIESLESLYDEQ